jgi:hypothetical protein
MGKKEREFFSPDGLEWTVAGSGYEGIKGVFEKVLSADETGSITRLLKFEPGVETRETLTHDFWEEVIILKGGLIDRAKCQIFTEGMYACRPPGMKHGPYSAPVGCITYEIRYYK